MDILFSTASAPCNICFEFDRLGKIDAIPMGVIHGISLMVAKEITRCFILL